MAVYHPDPTGATEGFINRLITIKNTQTKIIIIVGNIALGTVSSYFRKNEMHTILSIRGIQCIGTLPCGYIIGFIIIPGTT